VDLRRSLGDAGDSCNAGAPGEQRHLKKIEKSTRADTTHRRKRGNTRKVKDEQQALLKMIDLALPNKRMKDNLQT